MKRTQPPLQSSPRRVQDLLRSCIRSGMMSTDQPLVEYQLVKTYASSRNAVREALRLLADEGLVTRKRRFGTLVSAPVIEMPVDDIKSVPGSPTMTVTRIDNQLIPSTELIRARLQTETEQVGMVEHLFYSEGHPMGVRVAYYHGRYTQPTHWDVIPDLRTGFEAVYGVALGRVETHIDARACEPRTAELLEVAEGSPVLVREQLLYDVAGQPKELTFSHYRCDRVTFKVSGPLRGPIDTAVAQCGMMTSVTPAECDRSPAIAAENLNSLINNSA